MLIDARLKQDELKIKLIQAFDDPVNEGYFIDNDDPVVDFNNMSTARNARAYASVNKAGEVIGYISYAHDVATRRFYGIGAINFTDDKLTFASDLLTLFRRAFTQKNALTIEFKAISDNPACSQYERFIKRVHGELVGVLHDYVITPDGKLHDMNIYEIRRAGDTLAKDYNNGLKITNVTKMAAHPMVPKSTDTDSFVHTSLLRAHQLCATIEKERERFIPCSSTGQLALKFLKTSWGYISNDYIYIQDDRFERVLNASGIAKNMKSRVLNTLADKGIFCAGPHSDQTSSIEITEVGSKYSDFTNVYQFKRGPEFDALAKSV